MLSLHSLDCRRRHCSRHHIRNIAIKWIRQWMSAGINQMMLSWTLGGWTICCLMARYTPVQNALFFASKTFGYNNNKNNEIEGKNSVQPILPTNTLGKPKEFKNWSFRRRGVCCHTHQIMLTNYIEIRGHPRHPSIASLNDLREIFASFLTFL